MFVISTRNFPPDVGGIQSLMEGLAKALVNHGPVQVFADRFQDSDRYDENSDLKIERVSGFKIFRKYRKANLVSEFIKNNNIRAIFFDHWKSIENLNENNFKNIPSFCLIHSKEINHVQGTSLNNRMNKALNKSKYIVSNSNFTKDLAVKFGVKKDKIHIINPGTDYPIEINEDVNKKVTKLYKDSFPKIITIARLDKRKNHQNILMCIRNLKEKFPKIKYVCVGDGEEKKNLEHLKKELNLENEVVFIDQTDEQFKVALLRNSDLFLMPSIVYKKSVEGFGISFIEAASYGKGSIGGKDGGEQDAIKNNITGYICNGNDLNSIYENIIKFFKDDNYKILGSNAFEFSKSFKWNKIIKQYLNLI